MMKMKVLSQELKSTIAYIASSLLTKGLAFITIPIFTRLMSTEEIGIVNIYNSWFSIIYAFSTLSVTSGGYQVALNKFGQERKKYVSSVTFLTSLMTFILAVLFAFFPKQISSLLGMNKKLIMLLLLGLFTTPAMDLWLAKEKYEYKYKIATLITILSAILATGLSALAVVKIDNSAQTRLIANFSIIYGISLCIWIYLMISGHTFYNRKYWSFSIKISVPMIAYALSAQILNASDRLMINRIEGASAAGIYGTLYTVCTISLIAWNAVNASFVPYLHKNIVRNRGGIRKKASVLLLGYAFCVVLITYFSPEIIKIFTTAEYYDAIAIMPPIAAGVALMAVSNLYSNILLYYQKSYIIMASAFVAAALNIALNAIFIPLYGYKAAAYSTLFAYICLAGFQAYYVIKKKVGMRDSKDNMIYNNSKLLKIAIVCVFACMFGIVLFHYQLIRYIVIICLSIVFFIYLFKNNVVKLLLK